MTKALVELTDQELAVRAVEIGQAFRKAIARLVSPAEAARLAHNIKALKDRFSKVRTDEGQAFLGELELTLAWLEAQQRGGALLGAGQDAGTIRTAGRRPQDPNSAKLSELEIEAQESSRWQRLASIHPEDWRTFEEHCRDNRIQPTQTAALRLADGETPENERPWLRVYTEWNFQSPDPAFGQEHPGMIPGQVLQNLNYYFTQPGDLIVDLFAGGGMAIDVCAAKDDDYGNRKCLAFDRKPVRKDIKRWDLTEGLPEFPDAAMVFLDPPYWGQKAGEYSGDATDLANMPLEQFNKTLGAVVGASLKRAQYVALIIGATQKDGQFYDHAAWLMGAFGAPRHRFQVPYSTEQYQAFDVARAKKNKAYLNVCRDLMVWDTRAR
jgi:hypothetical protein